MITAYTASLAWLVSCAVFPVQLILSDVLQLAMRAASYAATLVQRARATVSRALPGPLALLIAVPVFGPVAFVLAGTQALIARLQSPLNPFPRQPIASTQLAKDRTADPLLVGIAAHTPFTALRGLMEENPGIMDVPDEKGATPLLYACLMEHWELVRAILNCDEFAASDRLRWCMTQYSRGSPFEGENALHIAVVQHRTAELRFLLDFVTKKHHAAFLTQQAVGPFFAPGKQEWDVFGRCVSRMAKSTEFVRLYYGGYPLAFAVCTDQADVVCMLVNEYGADVYAKDRYGNTLLHMCVIHELANMFDTVVTLAHGEIVIDKGVLWRPPVDLHGPKRPLWEEANQVKVKHSAGPSEMCQAGEPCFALTPLVFACELGSVIMFQHQLKLRRHRQWKYGAFSSYFYALEELSGREGAVAVAVRNSHTHLIQLPVIKRLLHKQWESGVCTIFRHKLYKALLVNAMVTLTSLGCYVAPEVKQWAIPTSPLSLAAWVGFSCFNGALSCLALAKLHTEAEELGRKGWEYFKGPFTGVFENVCSSLLNVFILSLVGIRHCPDPVAGYESFVASLVFFFGWAYILFFLLGYSKETGVFLISLWRMFFEDVGIFAIVYVVFAMAFSGSFFHLLPAAGHGHGGGLANDGDASDKTYGEFLEYQHHLLETALGGYDIKDYRQGHYSVLSSTLYILYTILVPVLLINVLTAKMTVTIEHINESSICIWTIERARIMQSLIDEEPDGWNGLLEKRLVNKFWKEFDVESYDDYVDKTRDKGSSHSLQWHANSSSSLSEGRRAGGVSPVPTADASVTAPSARRGPLLSESYREKQRKKKITVFEVVEDSDADDDMSGKDM